MYAAWNGSFWLLVVCQRPGWDRNRCSHRTGRRSRCRSGRCRRLEAQIAVQFTVRDPLVAETGQGPQMTAFDQVEDGFIVHSQDVRDVIGSMNYYRITHAFGRGGDVTNRGTPPHTRLTR